MTEKSPTPSKLVFIRGDHFDPDRPTPAQATAANFKAVVKSFADSDTPQIRDIADKIVSDARLRDFTEGLKPKRKF